MSTKRTTLNPGIKTVLIILGIILAAVLTWHSSTFMFSSIPLFQGPVSDATLTASSTRLIDFGEFLIQGDLFDRVVQAIRK